MPRRNRRLLLQAGAPVLIGILALASVGSSTQLKAPPYYDGAGYAVLGLSLAGGHGYREINRPDAPRHAHFPPAYPLALSAVFRVCGPAAAPAHVLSVACTMLAAVAAWAWFRRLYPPGTAFLLGMAVAVNWTWGRIGGSIQSEPLYLLLSMVALWLGTRNRHGGLAVGLVLGACVLTRHVGVCLLAAVILDAILDRRLASALGTAVVATLCVVPWIAWLVQARRGSQAGLFHLDQALATAASQAVFYAQRIPDQVAGPFVEIATVYVRHPVVARVATGAALLATSVVVAGWARSLRSPRRRIVGLAGFLSLALLLVWPFTEAGRFLIPLLPMVLVGAVEGLTPLLRALKRARARRWAAAIVLAASLPYALYALATDRAGGARRTHRDFDAACRWLAREHDPAGPILTHYPADVYWQTRRHALEQGRAVDPAAIGRLIDRNHVAYVLVDEKPFTNAPPDPLARYAAAERGRAALVWGRPGGVAVYAVMPLSPR